VSKQNLCARDGKHKSFDAEGDGFVRSEGCGVVVLKQLSKAAADGDEVLAIIRGSAVNHDGRSASMYAPSGVAQQKAVRQALADAHLQPADIDVVETHSTGKVVGDAIEVNALGEVFGSRTENPLILHTYKTNTGCMEGAASIAALIKTVMVVRNRKVPPLLHLRRISPLIDLKRLRAVFPTSTMQFNQPVIAGVTTFGFGGSNVHMIVAESSGHKLVVNDPEERTEASSSLCSR
jgi:acyl transferase domain-containing protein